MTKDFGREFKLAGSRGDGSHPYINADGAFVGRGVPLLERDVFGQFKPRPDAVLERLFETGYGTAIALDRRAAQLRSLADALNRGDLALAGIILVQMRLPPLPSAERAHVMARADGLIDKYNPDWEDEPRVPAGTPDGGQWTDEGGGEPTEPDGALTPAAAHTDATQARKERFVDAHLADAQRVADQLGIPAENILGVSALESEWGESRFAIEGHNFFGIHYPAPYATGYLIAGRSPVKVATFASYAESARSFATIAGSDIRGLRDPSDFAAALWNSGKFGVGRPTYVADLARTIRGLRAIVSRRDI